MKNWKMILCIAWFVVGCGETEIPRNSIQFSDNSQQTSGNDGLEGSDELESPPTQTGDQEPINPESSQCGSLESEDCVVVSALYRHCASCHAIGNKRFIYDDSFENTLEYITNVNYEDNKSWVAAIRDSIDWEGGVMPEFGEEREDNKQYMPLGKKRDHMNEEVINGEPLQQIMMRVLNKYAK